MYLDGRRLRGRGPRGELIVDDSYLLVLHSGDEPITFALPDAPWAASYETVIDTANPGGAPEQGTSLPGGSQLSVGPRTSLLLRVNR
jgi:isoamylase